MKTNEETFYENVGKKNVTENILNEEKQETASDRDNIMKRAIMLGGAILAGGSLGGGIAYATSQSTSKPETEEVFEIIDEGNEKSFEQAFNDAREQLGPGAAFRWRGGVYSTYTKEEWENMSDEEQEAFNSKVRPIMSESDKDPNHYRASATHNEPEHNHHKEVVENTRVTHHDDFDISSEKVVEIQGRSVVMANGTHNGKDIVLLDLDKDGRYDVMVEDLNDDGSVTDNEYIDISGRQINVHNTALIHASTPEVRDEYIVLEEAETEIEGDRVIVARAEHNGQPAVLIDIDMDGRYDAAIEDTNRDGELTREDYRDISANNIRVHDPDLLPTDVVNVNDPEPVVEINAAAEELREGTVMTTGTVDGKNAVIIDVNRDGTYDVAYVDQNSNNDLDENEMKPVNIVSANAHVHNTTLIDAELTDNGLNGEEDNTPDYMNTAAVNENTETDITIEVDADNGETYMANADEEDLGDSREDDVAALQYDDTAFNDPSVSDTMTDITDDYAAS